MREIKFRAWDNLEERMYNNVEGGIYQDPDEIVPFDKILGFASYDVMQYTGLKDKNGTEIYEGDICIVSLSYFNIKNEKAKVIFHNGAFQFQYGCEKFFSKPYDAWNEVEVIGNLYENPELLEGRE